MNLRSINSPYYCKNSEHCSLFLILLLSAVCLSACSLNNSTKLITYTGPIMGTDYRITVKLPASIDHDLLEQQILEQLNLVNSSMSTYLPESELSQFNRGKADSSMTLSSGLAEVVAESMAISVLSNGAFDITVGDAVSAWGFGPDGAITAKPDQASLAELHKSIGYQRLSLEGNRLSKKHDQTVIDLSAIAKGFAVDQVAILLLNKGLENFLINVGGELRASGVNQDELAWQVAIEKPQVLGGIQQIIGLDNAAIATSGDYRNYIIIDDQAYSHTIDPRTLEPKLHRLASVSVVSSKASTADALATALMVMGDEQGYEFASRHNLAAYFIMRKVGGDEFDVKFTNEFAAILQ